MSNLSIKHGISFANTLEKTCLVSKNNPKGMEKPENFLTLHQIAWKIIRQKNNADIVKKLAGTDMFEFVKEAVKHTFGVESEYLSKHYYSLIRGHKNNLEHLKVDPKGAEVLANYQNILKDNFDWEDSLQTASLYLKNNLVNTLYKFPYQNIILVSAELLQQSRNKNARQFFLDWCTWMEEYTRCNVFLVNDFGFIFKFEKGVFSSFKHIINFYDDLPFKLNPEYNLSFAL